MLFSDVEGSTATARALGDRWGEVLADHHHILAEAIRGHHGFVEDTEGDAFFATFATATDALAAAREAQETLRAHIWPREELRVRMGFTRARFSAR
jgi:class 3 adenylate cyclase